MRRGAWDAAGGFDERYFMYGEDLDLSLRLRLAGWGLGLARAAEVAHDYEFAKGDYKWFYLERNRWWTVIGAYPQPPARAAGPACWPSSWPFVAACRGAEGGCARSCARRPPCCAACPRCCAAARAVQAATRRIARAFAGR